MYSFTFRARDAFGGQLEAEVKAATVEEALNLLHVQGLIAKKADLLGQKREVWWGRLATINLRGLLSPVPPSDLLRFIRLLGGSLQRGRTLKETLTFLEENEDHRGLKRMLAALKDRINQPFRSQTEIFSLFPDYFDEAFLGIVQAGESSGNLGQYLMDYAEDRKKQLALETHFKTVLVSRGATFLMVLLVAGVVILFVIPQFKALFGDAVDIPFAMKVLLGLASFIRRFSLPLFFASLLGSGILYYAFTQSPALRLKWHHTLLFFPVLGKTLRTYYTAQFAYILSTLLSKNVSIVQAMDILIRQASNVCLQHTYRELLASMRAGDDLFTAINRQSECGQGYLIPSLTQAARMGAATSSLSVVLSDVRQDLDELFTTRLNRAIATFSRIFYAFIVGLAVFIAYGVGSALVAFYQNAQSLI